MHGIIMALSYHVLFNKDHNQDVETINCGVSKTLRAPLLLKYEIESNTEIITKLRTQIIQYND